MVRTAWRPTQHDGKANSWKITKKYIKKKKNRMRNQYAIRRLAQLQKIKQNKK